MSAAIGHRARWLALAAGCVGIIAAACQHTADEPPIRDATPSHATSTMAADTRRAPTSSAAETPKPAMPASASDPPPDAVVAVSNDGAYQVAYLPEPSPVPLNDVFSLHVWVRDAKNTAEWFSDAGLAADAAMPAHQHGMNVEPAIKPLGKGDFLVEGMLFHMAGHWELYLDVTRGGITERAQFDVELE